MWFDPGTGLMLPGEVIEYHRAAQVLTVQAVIAAKVKPKFISWEMKFIWSRSIGCVISIFYCVHALFLLLWVIFIEILFQFLVEIYMALSLLLTRFYWTGFFFSSGVKLQLFPFILTTCLCGNRFFPAFMAWVLYWTFFFWETFFVRASMGSQHLWFQVKAF